MVQQNVSNSRELKDAFSRFNQASDQLADSYRILEDRVGQLTGELAIERSRRFFRESDNEQTIRRFEGLLDALPAAIIVLDGDGYVQQCNRAAIELIGEPLLSLLWRDVVARAFEPTVSGDDVPLKDGRIVNIATRPVGDVPGQIILLTDVTEARAMQAMLNRHQRLSAMGEMVASIAHQIRTPLASGLLYASHLKRNDLDQGRRARYAEQIFSRLKHLERLVDEMLVFARGGNFSADQVRLPMLMDELQQMMLPLLEGGTCELEIVNSADVQISGHYEALSAVLQNLVSNAIQACDHDESGDNRHAGGKVKVESRNLTDKTVDIYITDNGHGIPESIQQRIFEPFFTTKAQGTGLGLAVVQAIVNGHDGAIWIESSSTSNQSGTTFVVRLPLLKEIIDK
ncbi:MAG TPA: PAS domain-containing protein [Chromatiales bacterium]|nr:PAS domain-containing protein [Chromatiales bacterium]